MKILIAVLVFLFIISINISILCFEPIFSIINDNDDAINVLRYVNGQNFDLNFFTENEILHLNDVKIIINIFKYYAKIGFVLLLLSIFTEKTKFVVNSIKISSILILSFSFFMLLYSVFFFENFFTTFHKIFFPKGNWLFEYNSKLIQLFPLDFWYKIALIFILMNIFDGIILLYLHHSIAKN
ncbi:MAG: DUF1461 domain-containing protein [Candidatus Aenigmatarchaeota archaeon]|nr:DUF1461 domain-containing protein [Candidatus Aenigmarchaeota archaeon]